MTPKYQNEAANECTQYDVLEGYVPLLCVASQPSDTPAYLALSPMDLKGGETSRLKEQFTRTSLAIDIEIPEYGYQCAILKQTAVDFSLTRNNQR